MALRAPGLRLIRSIPGLLVFGFGCEVLVDGRLDSVHCAEEGAVGPPACPDGEYCKNGACVDVAQVPRDLGVPCDVDSDCGPEAFCLDPALFGGAGSRVCARPCCSSADCDPNRDTVCWVPERGGGGFCRRARAVGRPDAGTRMAGEACSSPSDCRSALCQGGLCADSCCSDTNCAAARATCRLSQGFVSSGYAWACQPADTGKRGYFEECGVDEDCASGLCLAFDGQSRCTVPCCSSDTCPVVRPGGAAYTVACVDLVIRDGSTVRACAGSRPDDSFGDVGVACALDQECRSGLCVRSPGEPQGFCSDVCCTEASCGDVSLFGCRPYRTGPSWVLRCAPK